MIIMQIVPANYDFIKKGFGNAVALSAADESNLCADKIIAFALKEGHGKPITDGKTTELILIQLPSGRQIAVDTEDIKEDLENHIN
jgi:hypothetical protein